MTELNTNGLIADLAWILLLGAIVTLLFKKLRQPVVLGYILAGFLASPKFIYLPSISNLVNIEFWAELGIVILMFCLGLEFSFKKLVNAGSSAILTALIVITGMTFCGFGVGRLLNLNTINCIFLGGMISMSSTTIILKALGDLGLRQKKFASLVLAVLIIEDLFAVLMLVLLSSLAMGTVSGSELLFSVGKLVFFLIIWFVVGVYVLPSFFSRARSFLNAETTLVVSMGLCFAMAVFSVMCGFSLELGAFVMGSILAGTMAAEKIEKVVAPVKDLFGAVFFISVGMMVDPTVIAQYWGEILILAAVVIVGMIIFGTIGMLLTGQTLKVAIESGFTLTQIGEFSFIIASLGMSLGVLEHSLYPIIVAVSVITIFTTPYFIKMASPAYRFVEKRLPSGLRFLIDRYAAEGRDSSDLTASVWKNVVGRFIWRIVLFSVILIAEVLVARMWLYPLLEKHFLDWGHLISTAVTIGAMLPFLIALTISGTKKEERHILYANSNASKIPLMAMRVIRYLVAFSFLVYFISLAYNATVGWIVGAVLFLIIILFAGTHLRRVYTRIENKFMDNLNIRENTRSGKNRQIVDDLHQAYIEVGQSCSFIGEKVRDTGLRRDFGVSISSIQRGEDYIPLPSIDARLFPGDIIGVIGTDDQIQRLNEALEKDMALYEKRPKYADKVVLKSLTLSENSPIVGVELGTTDLLGDYGSMIVKVQRGDEFILPSASLVLAPQDVVWVVGDPNRIHLMK